MNRVSAVLWAKRRIVRHQIASVRNESMLKVGVVSVSAVLLWLGAFWAFCEAFIWFKQFGAEQGGDALSLGDIIMSRLLSVFALALFCMLIFSNVLIAFSTLYRSREVAFLIQTPLPWWEFFLTRFVECVGFSSWASAYLGSPLILAYGLINGAPPAFYVAAAAFYIPFVTMPAAVGAIVAMLLVRVFPRLPRGAFIGLAVVALVFVFVLVHSRVKGVERHNGDEIITSALAAMKSTQSWMLPSYWASRGVLASADRAYGESLFYFLLLSSNALMLTVVAAGVAQLLYYPGWSSLFGYSLTRTGRRGGLLSRIDGLLTVLKDPHRALVAKDIKLFWRDPAQWSQFVIFFGIMAVYVASLRDRSAAYEVALWRAWIVCLNIGACTLILATLTSRFVFPLISLEGRRFWVVGLAPVTFKQLIWQKFWLSVGTTSVFTITLVVLSCYMLDVEPVAFTLAVYSIVITNFGLSGLAVGLGSLFPNFQEDNPARIVSGMGGTLNFLLSMAYIALVVGAETVILIWRTLEFYAEPRHFWLALAGVVVFITVLSAISTIVPLRLGLRNLNQSEY